MTDHRLAGAHELWVEGDTVCVRYHGAISVAGMEQIIAYIEAVADRIGSVFLLVDSNELVFPSVEVRRLLAERGYARVKAQVRFQRDFAQTAGMSVLLQNAARLLGRPSVPTKVVETEAEARAWLAEVRMATGSAR